MELEPTPPLAPMKASDAPQGRAFGIVVERGDGLDELDLLQRRDKIFADRPVA